MSQLSNKWIYVILTLVTLLGLQLRLQAVRYTVVDTPIRADARDYLLYAINLKEFHIYSRSPDALDGKVSAPTPDAVRSPGYPLFVSIFIGDLVTDKTLLAIELAQALLSTLTILLAYFAFAALLKPSLALLVALFTAISPHLVFTNVFILSETLSCFFLMVFLWFLTRWKSNPSVWLLLGTGMALALATLTRPWTQYFIILLAPLIAVASPLVQPKRGTVLLGLGFVMLMMFWAGRNLLTLGVISDNAVTAILILTNYFFKYV